MRQGWQCETCGEWHEDVPLSFAAGSPDPYAHLSQEDREERTILGSDQCVIDGEQYFIRGLLEIPILGSEERFLWGLWAKVFPKDYEEISESWEEASREATRGPFKALLANEVKLYPDSLDLRLMLHVQPVGERPLFVLQEAEHPLVQDQRHGITPEAAAKMGMQLLHAS